ncbi:hypothetical protein CCUS01_12887 [Colletotrichum cuscutae]|nr:hypothetical protein CCUS01_12887 [Colletotrichum cuscutae]
MSTLILAVELETPEVTVPSALSTLDWHHWNLAWKLGGKVCRVRPTQTLSLRCLGDRYSVPSQAFPGTGKYLRLHRGWNRRDTSQMYPRYFVASAPGPWKEGASRIEITTGSTSPHRTSPYHLACLPNVYGGSEHLGSTADAAAVTSRQSYQG